MREGIWDGKPAVFKIYECVEANNLGNARKDICTALKVLADLSPLQVRLRVKSLQAQGVVRAFCGKASIRSCDACKATLQRESS